MRRVLPWLLWLAIGCGDDDVPEPAEPTLAVVRHDRCLPAELEGADVRDAPRLSDEGGTDEVAANYALGDALVRVHVLLYDEAEAQTQRELEQTMLERCDSRPACEEQRIAGRSARLVDLGIAGQESTAFFLEPGIRVSVLAPTGRSAAFAELLDYDCLTELHAERRAH